MAQEGWISIRNVPRVNPRGSVPAAQIYYNRLQNFFGKYTICPECFGDGYTKAQVRPAKDTIIKFKGISELEILYHRASVNVGEIIREILSIELEGRTACRTCEGHRFVARRKKSKNSQSEEDYDHK